MSLVITPFDAAAILIVLAAALGYINHRFIGLPTSIGQTIMGAVASRVRSMSTGPKCAGGAGQYWRFRRSASFFRRFSSAPDFTCLPAGWVSPYL
ncbi:hypothetical protein [Sphingopyxis terrae]|nr:hypothetical protein [Sphingopyxis terrae]